jgi:hypothetical protein
MLTAPHGGDDDDHLLALLTTLCPGIPPPFPKEEYRCTHINDVRYGKLPRGRITGLFSGPARQFSCLWRESCNIQPKQQTSFNIFKFLREPLLMITLFLTPMEPIQGRNTFAKVIVPRQPFYLHSAALRFFFFGFFAAASSLFFTVCL